MNSSDDLEKINQIKNIVFNNIKSFGTLIRNHHPDLLKFINDKTPLLQNEKFKISQKIHWIINGLTEFPKCKNPNCNKSLEDHFLSINRGYQTHCCDKCSQLDPIIADKRIQNTNKDRYKNGMLAFSQKYFEKTGFKCPLKNPLIIEKRTNSRILNRFNKIKNSEIGNCLFSFDEYLYAIKNGAPIKFCCNLCGKEFSDTYDKNWEKKHGFFGRCPYCFPKNGCSSTFEKELFYFVKNALKNIKVEHNRRILNENYEINNWKTNKELDIFIPKLNIGIEFNGLYFHSINRTGFDYHLSKTILSENLGIKLIHIYEDEWNTSKELIKTFLLNFFNGIYDYNQYSFVKNDLIYIRRDKFNKQCKINGLELIDETNPTIDLRIKNSKEQFFIENCGYLIFRKLHDAR